MKRTGLFFGLLLLLASCSQDQLNPSSTQLVDAVVRVSLHTAPMKVFPSTRSTTLPVSSDDVRTLENRIKHLWGFQFAATKDGTGKLLTMINRPVDNPNDIDITFKGSGTGIESKFYFVANMGSAVFPSAVLPDAGAMTENQFKAQLSAAIANEGGFLLQNGSSITDHCIPMFGECKEPVTVYGGGAMDKLDINLVRMLARVDLIYSVPTTFANFSLQGIRVCNVPKKLRYYCATDASYVPTYGSEVVPTITTSSEELLNTEFETTVKTQATPITLTYYLPENHRGVGTNTIDGGDGLKTGISNATYFEFTGLTSGTTSDVLTYKLYPGKDSYNDYNLDRNSYYTLTAELSGESDPRISALAKSNCYIVTPGGESVSIPISRANEGDPAKPIKNISNPDCTVSVLWQAVSDGTNHPNYITLGNTDCKGGFFTVSVPSGVPEGNAVVCIKRNNTILWSWHIWVTNSTTITTKSLNGIPFMDRNLGATSAALPDFSLWTVNVAKDYNDVGSLGLLYQWGRKDPFPNVSAYPVTVAGAIGTFTDTHKPVYFDGVGQSMTSKLNPTTTDSPKIIDDAVATTSPNHNEGLVASIQNPLIFYKSTSGNWYSATSGTKNDGLWCGVKTAYDPCPVGWRVPLYTSWNGLDTKKVGTTTSNLWDDFSAFNWSNQTLFVGRTASTALYPASGYRSTDGTFVGLGNGLYWSGSVNGNFAYALSFGADAVSTTLYDRTKACSIRCVHE